PDAAHRSSGLGVCVEGYAQGIAPRHRAASIDIHNHWWCSESPQGDVDREEMGLATRLMLAACGFGSLASAAMSAKDDDEAQFTKLLPVRLSSNFNGSESRRNDN